MFNKLLKMKKKKEGILLIYLLFSLPFSLWRSFTHSTIFCIPTDLLFWWVSCDPRYLFASCIFKGIIPANSQSKLLIWTEAELCARSYFSSAEMSPLLSLLINSPWTNFQDSCIINQTIMHIKTRWDQRNSCMLKFWV